MASSEKGINAIHSKLHVNHAIRRSGTKCRFGQLPLSRTTMRTTIAGSVVFGLLLFLGIPLLLARAVHGGARSVGQILIEGVIRALVLLTYLFLIGRVGNVKRVFAYHGAEHKAINALEAGLPSDVASVRVSSRLHPRCGTGFIVVVAFVSIVVFAPLGTLPVLLRLFIQILLVPVVAGISYEAIRGLARIRHTAAGRIALVPILAAQRLTTREPDDAQIEVAIAALDAARMGDTIVGEQHAPLII